MSTSTMQRRQRVLDSLARLAQEADGGNGPKDAVLALQRLNTLSAEWNMIPMDQNVERVGHRFDAVSDPFFGFLLSSLALCYGIVTLRAEDGDFILYGDADNAAFSYRCTEAAWRSIGGENRDPETVTDFDKGFAFGAVAVIEKSLGLPVSEMGTDAERAERYLHNRIEATREHNVAGIDNEQATTMAVAEDSRDAANGVVHAHREVTRQINGGAPVLVAGPYDGEQKSS